MQRRLHILPLLITVIVLLFIATVPAFAGGLTLSPAFLSGQGAPGTGGQFDGYVVTNATAVPLQVTVQPVPDPDSALSAADAAWFRFTPAGFDLAPGAEQKITVSVAIPAAAKPGAYETLVQVGAERAGAKGVGLNMTLNARLKLTVLPSPNPLGGMPLPPEPSKRSAVAGPWLRTASEKMAEPGVAQAWADGTFVLDMAVNHVPFVKMMVLTAAVLSEVGLLKVIAVGTC